MEKVFIEETNKLVDALATRIKADTLENYQLHKDSGMTPTQAKALAVQQINLCLAQELYFNLSKY